MLSFGLRADICKAVLAIPAPYLAEMYADGAIIGRSVIADAKVA